MAQVIDFVVTPVADDTFIRAPRFIFENSDGSLILEDQANPIEIPLSIELPDGGETIEDVVITGLPEGGSLQLILVDGNSQTAGSRSILALEQHIQSLGKILDIQPEQIKVECR